ncbi:MAG TPA: hypothetical protein VGW96_02285, partial [Candidatus Eremiobacteraceae bacterium]|nr:hypothetical protein [Candidatus Eremiobacteraceae bacterium]
MIALALAAPHRLNPFASPNLGRHLFGVAAVAFGVITLVWHDYKDWDQLRSILNATTGPVFLYVAAAAQILGGLAIQFPRTAKMGAAVLVAVYLVLALLYVPRIIAKPQVYDRWGNFFEWFSLVIGPAIVYARLSPRFSPETVGRIARILMGVCVASFTVEQAIHLGPTASLVPKWLPPSQMFWAVTTTVAFALAAVALLTNCMTLLATRLLTTMLVIFGLLVWVPILL